MRALIASLLIAFPAIAEVPLILDYEFEFKPRPKNEAVETYWLWRRVSGSPVSTLAAVTTNESVIVASNVTTLIAYEWSLTASNKLGMSDPTSVVPTPVNPRPPTELKPVRVSMRVRPPVLIEQGESLENWSSRFVLMNGTDGYVRFTYCLSPDEPLMFWRWKEMSAALPPALKTR